MGDQTTVGTLNKIISNLFHLDIHAAWNLKPEVGAISVRTLIQGDQKVSVHLTITVHTTDDLKTATTEYLGNVDCAILNMVLKNTVRHINKCLETGGGHFEHYL
jgi:hypothetical protein